MQEIPSTNFKPEKVPAKKEGLFAIGDVLKRWEQEGFAIPQHATEIKEKIDKNPAVVVMGETGSRKTTALPLFILELLDKLPTEGKIAVSQPRRVAARSVARYVAGELGCRVGNEIGFQVRFEDRTTEGTLVNFMTDGILLRKIQDDPLLRDYAAVMVDEAHERSLNIDFTLGLLKRLQKERAKANIAPLKIIVASATLEKEKFAKYFSDSPLVEVPGRLYPIETYFLTEAEENRYIVYDNRKRDYVFDYSKAAVDKLKFRLSLKEDDHDFLIFMPGQEEIRQAIDSIKAMLQENSLIEEFDILPLFGDMPLEEQDKVMEKTGKRRIVVATNIAETSITLPRPVNVINSGLIKQKEFNSLTGIDALVTRAHAKSGMKQREGRAGRLAPGKCDHLCTEADFNSRPEFQTPEIQRSDLAHVVLIMKQIGIDNVKSFEFIDTPEASALDQALETLKTLGALDDEEKLTEIGEVMAELPLEPEKARMVIEAKKYGCVEAVCTIASFLGKKSVFNRPDKKKFEADAAHAKFKNFVSDFLTFLNVWQAYEASDYRDGWARDNFLNAKALAEVRQVRYQLLRALRRNDIEASKNADPDVIGKSIAAGLVGNLMEYSSRHAYRRVKDNAGGFFIHPSSAAFSSAPRFFVSAEIVRTTKTFARVIQELKPQWIPEIAPQFTHEKPREAYYDPAKDQVMQKFSVSMRGSYQPFLEEERPLAGEGAVRVFSEALASGKIDHPLAKENKATVDTLNDLWRRAEGSF